MKSKIEIILNKTQFFKITNVTNKSITYTLEESSWLLIRNIYADWLRYLNLKTQKCMPIYVHKLKHNLQESSEGETRPFGIIHHNELEIKNKTFQYHIDAPFKKIGLELKLIIPKQDVMQYFIQWQRYRKYWWSSISTTPSLFAIGSIKQGHSEAGADIVAKLPGSEQTVEHIKIINSDNVFKESACLTCTMSLEGALFILLLDGLTNDSKSKYLRLHRKIAPYKMSFALNFEEIKNKQALKELATLLFHCLNLEKVSARLPDFSISLEDQINENLHMGIPFTAIINETTLQNGILHLMNSSTMLKEQLHVADFHTYAPLICNDK